MALDSKLFCALLRYWRTRRGLSQLDLSLVADVSSRHISFLETGRAQPSEAMVLRLAEVLDLPLRDRNTMLTGAGFEAHFPEPHFDAMGDPAIERAIERMLAQHEPFPMLVVDRSYDVLRANAAAQRMFGAVVGGEIVGRNALVEYFDPTAMRAHAVDWEAPAHEIISRLQREALHRPQDERLAALLERLLAFPGVPEAWRQPDFARGSSGTVHLSFALGPTTLTFLTTLMQFNAPQNITLEELRIEAYFPVDEATQALCEAMAAGG